MRPLHALLLSLAAASAVASAEHGMRHGGDAAMPCHHEREGGEDEPFGGLIAALNEHFQRSGELLQRFFSLEGPPDADAAVRIVVIEEESPEEAQEQRKRACLKAVERIHEQDELQAQAQTLATYFRSMVDVVSLQVWGETSCDDLESPELVEQCNTVLSSEGVVRKFLEDGKTDDEVCDIMATVTDLEGADNLSCKLCQRFIEMVDQALAQEVQQVQQVRAIIGDLCDAMSADSMCHTFLKNYDAIVDWLKHGTDPLVVCERIAMCSPESSSGSKIADVPAAPDMPETVEDRAVATQDFVEKDSSCSFCTRVAGIVYQANNEFSDQLQALKPVLGNVCQMASEDSKCLEVEASFDRIVELVQQGQNPREVCGNVDFCPMKPKHGEMRPSDRMDGGDKTCVYCDAATTVVEVVLQEAPDQVDQIRDYADMICGMLGDDSPCHEYVNKLDTVIDSLKKGVHPRAICKALKYCPAGRMDTPSLEDSPHVGMMRNGRHGNHGHLGMEGPEGRHHHHGHGPRGEMGMMRGDEHPPHPPHPRPHGSCFFCSRVAMVIHHVNHTSPEKLPIVKTILSNVCQLVPSTCKCDVVDKNFDKIVELEKQGKHPHEICKSLGVCNKTEEATPSIAEEMKGLVVATQWAPGNATECTYCQFATTVARLALQQYGADIRQVRAYADMICDMLGADNPCHVYVKEFDFVIDSITKGMSSKAICTELKFCPGTVDEQLAIADGEDKALVLSSEERKPHNHGCSFCIHAAIVIHHVNKTEPEKLPIVKTILTDVCKLATPDCKCDEVNKNFDKIVELEKAGKCPHEICKAIGLCKKKVDVIADEYSLTDSVSALAFASRPDAVECDTKTCFFCDYVTSLVQAAYEQDATKIDQIKQLADTACALMGEESGCHPYIAQLDYVLESLKNGTHPHAICVSMKYCPDNSTLDEAALPSSVTADLSAYDPALVQMVKESMEVSVDACFFCTQLASVMEVAVAEDPSKISQIRQIADVVCGMLPSDNQCHSFVKQFDTVVDSLQKGEKPKAICHDLKYCTVDANPAMAKLAMPSSDMISLQTSGNEGSSCAYCNGVVTVLKYALDQKPEQVKEMREAAGIVCQLLPADDTCHDDLKMFDEAVTDLQAGKEPQEICQTLKFCTATDAPNKLMSGLLDFTGGDFLPSRCTTCQQNTLLLASLITRPDSLATFEHGINSVCRLIPESSECELLMKHQDAIIDSLKKNEDVGTICTRIEECGPAVEEVSEEKSMSVSCLFCEYTADLLEHAKNNEKALREAKMALETMCTVLPPLARCDVLSSKFDQLVSLMREGKNPREACGAVALCEADFVQSSDDDEAMAQAFEKARQSVGNMMEIQ